MGAVALYAGARLPRRWAWVVPIAAMALADLALDYGHHRPILDLTRWTTSFSRTALFSSARPAIGTGTEAREMPVGVVNASFFGFFDAPPVIGRYFTPTEDAPPNGTPLAVLGYGYWRARYGGRREVLGESIEIGATHYSIVGVAPTNKG